MRDPEEASILQGLTQTFRIIEVDFAIASRAIQLRRTTRLKLADAIIYATALEHGLTLITRNTRDFDEKMSSVRIPYSV